MIDIFISKTSVYIYNLQRIEQKHVTIDEKRNGQNIDKSKVIEMTSLKNKFFIIL